MNKMAIALALMVLIFVGPSPIASDIKRPDLTSVTLYRNAGGLLTYQLKADLKPGITTLTLPGLLPENYKQEGFEIIPPKGVSLEAVTFEDVERVLPESPALQAQRKVVDDILAQKTKMLADIKRLETQIALLSKPSESDPTPIDKRLTLVAEKLPQWVEDEARIRRALTPLNKDLYDAKEELEKLEALEEDRITLNISLGTNTATSATIQIHMPTDNAEWSPNIIGRLDTETSMIELEMVATISQDTGQDWANVPAILQVNPAYDEAREFEFFERYLGLEDPKELAKRAEALRLQRKAAAYAPAADDYEVEEVLVTGGRSTGLSFKGLSKAITLSSLSLKTDTMREEAVVYQHTQKVTQRVMVAPLERDDAVLVADFIYNGELGIDASRVNRLVDAIPLGDIYWPDINPGRKITLPFKTVKTIEVDAVPVDTSAKDAGLFGSRREKIVRKLLRVKNTGSSAQTVDIYALLPQSTDDDLLITLLDTTPDPSEKDVDNTDGLYRWQRVIAAGETAEIDFGYRLKYPEDQIIVPE